jgi:hypothetical protein
MDLKFTLMSLTVFMTGDNSIREIEEPQPDKAKVKSFRYSILKIYTIPPG